MIGLRNKDDIEDQWSHAVSYAKKAGGIIPGRKISFKSNTHSYVIKAHWQRWIFVLILFVIVLIHFLPILLPLILPLDKEYHLHKAIPLAVFSFLWIYFACRLSIPTGKIVFRKESSDIHITYGTILHPHRVVIPSEHVVLRTYMFKADKRDVRIKYGNTILSMVNENQRESELVLASVQSEKKIPEILEGLSVYIKQDANEGSSGTGIEQPYLSLTDWPQDEWLRLVKTSQSKKPFLNVLVSSTNKLIVKESPEHVLITNRKPWFIGLLLLTFGIFMISMLIAVTIKEQEFNVLVSIMSLGVSLFFLVPAYTLLAWPNRILLKHSSNTIHLKYGYYPFAEEMSFSKDSLLVSLYRCDIGRANKVRKPGQTILSLLHGKSGKAELILSTSDTEIQVDSAFEKLSSFIGKSSQSELTEEIVFSEGENVTVPTTSLSGNALEKRKFCVISKDIVAFKGSWLYPIVFGGTFIIGVILAMSFINDEPDERLFQRILSIILAIVVCSFMILGGIAFFFHSLFTRCVVADKTSDALIYSPRANHPSKAKALTNLSEIEAIQLCSVCTSVVSDNSRRGTTVYEMNVITNQDESRRISITSSEKYDQISSDANAFAEFLGVPVLDHTVT